MRFTIFTYSMNENWTKISNNKKIYTKNQKKEGRDETRNVNNLF